MTKIYLTPGAQKDLKHTDKKGIFKIKRKLTLLEKEPYSGKKLVGELLGLFSLKAWPYRIIYLINKYKELWIIRIMHRKDAYKGGKI